MALRPRTARRLALIVGLLVIVAGGGVALLTIPRWQSNRLLARFQRDGMKAYEAGDYPEAVSLLGRHVRGMGSRPIDPDVRLALARARAEWETGDGGYLQVAISHYRDYLRDRPDDRAASQELLALFVKAGLWPEARDLGMRLRGETLDAVQPENFQILRDEVAARVRINPKDPVIAEIDARLLGVEHPAFADAWNAIAHRQAADDLASIPPIVRAYADSAPDSLGAKVLTVLTDGVELPNGQPTLGDAALSLAGSIGLDPATGQWPDAPALDDAEMARVMQRTFDLANMGAAAETVLRIASAAPKGEEFLPLLAQRLYWGGQHDDLLALNPAHSPGKPDADVLGYQGLAAMSTGKAERVSDITRELQDINQQFRAKAWLDALAARSNLDSGNTVEARARATAAVERDPLEPTMRLILGDVLNALGRTGEALDAWEAATELAVPAIWLDPDVRRVTALLSSSRGIEARDVVLKLGQRAPGSLAVNALAVRVYSALARSGLINASDIREAVRLAEGLAPYVEGAQRADLSLSVAGMQAALGNLDKARAEIALALRTPGGEAMLPRALELDQRYQLGLAQQLGVPSMPERIDDPDTALGIALTFAAGELDGRDERVARAREMIDNSAAAAGPGSKPAWLRVRARFADAVDPDTAAPAWQAAISASPDDIDLLAEAVSSEALGYDLGFVSKTINHIVDLTASQGRTLPGDLRLARAKATFGKHPTRQTRDEAISIVRSVIASEPGNIRARNMLANMLKAECPPDVTDENQKFSPDLPGAIEQYLAASRLIEGSEAYAYLFEVARLQFRRDDKQQARQTLIELFARAKDDPAALRRVAGELRNLGANEDAARVLEDLFNNATGPQRVGVGLTLARTYNSLGSRARAQAVLHDLVRASEMTEDQVFDLADLLWQAGLAPEAESVVENAGRYGLRSDEVSIVQARYYSGRGSADKAVEILDAMLKKDPQRLDDWDRLVTLLIRAGRVDDARERLKAAQGYFPDSPALAYWAQYLSGDMSQALTLFSQQDSVDPAYRRAAERVSAYEKAKGTMSVAQRLDELRSISDTFAGVVPVLNFAFSERRELGEDPGVFATAVSAAARRHPTAVTLLSLATQGCLAAGRPADAAEFAAAWRGNVVGSPIEPDLYLAQARLALGRYAPVLEILGPYLPSAVATPDEPTHRQVLLYHSLADAAVNGPESVRRRLEPIAQRSPEFRTTVWLDVATQGVSDPDRAASWLDAVSTMGVGDRADSLTDAWVRLAERFPPQKERFLRRAVQVGTDGVAGSPSSMNAHRVLAIALRELAKAVKAPESVELAKKAEGEYLAAARLDPADQNMLFGAARSAEQAGDLTRAQEHYRSLLSQPGVGGLFAAVIRNNLASLMLQSQPDAVRAGQAADLVTEAIQVQGIPGFYATRGWANLLANRVPQAREDFDRATQLDPASAEGWAGVAASWVTGDSPNPTRSSAAVARLRSMGADVTLPAYAEKGLSDRGLGWKSDN